MNVEKVNDSPQKWLFSHLREVGVGPILLFFFGIGLHFLFIQLIEYFGLSRTPISEIAEHSFSVSAEQSTEYAA